MRFRESIPAQLVEFARPMPVWANMRDLGIYPLVVSELLFGSRHLSNTAVDESRHSSRRQRRPPGRRCARLGPGFPSGLAFGLGLGTQVGVTLCGTSLRLHSFDHLG
jgi:hypothetical protein